MSSTVSTVIALGSLGLAAITILVNYRNVQRQATAALDAALKLEHSKWILQRRDDVYRRLLTELVKLPDGKVPATGEAKYKDIAGILDEALMYASDAVLDDAQQLWKQKQRARTHSKDATAKAVATLSPALLATPRPGRRPGRVRVRPRPGADLEARLLQSIRRELAGEEEAAKTARRHAEERRRRYEMMRRSETFAARMSGTGVRRRRT